MSRKKRPPSDSSRGDTRWFYYHPSRAWRARKRFPEETDLASVGDHVVVQRLFPGVFAPWALVSPDDPSNMTDIELAAMVARDDEIASRKDFLRAFLELTLSGGEA